MTHQKDPEDDIQGAVILELMALARGLDATLLITRSGLYVINNNTWRRVQDVYRSLQEEKP